MATLTIPLSQGKYALIDEEDADLLAFSWHAKSDHGIYYARREIVLSQRPNRRRHVEKMHRVIASRMHGRELGAHEKVDHKDGDGLNNTRANLRLATNAQNLANRRGPTKRSQSGVLGVFWNKRKGRWTVSVQKDGQTVFRGNFKALEDAIAARRQAAQEIFGEFSPDHDEATATPMEGPFR